MRKREGYTFNFDQGQRIYRFTSSGPNGDIQKIVVISPAYGTTWNFAFGDANDDADGFDDEAITNNGDMRKVVQTLANIINDFLESHPDLQVILHPVDEKRYHLYNRVIQRNFDDINQVLSIYGLWNNEYELLQHPPLKLFDAFIVSRKNAIFELK